MKGVIFNLLEAYIVSQTDQDHYDNIISQCHLQTTDPFVGPGTYPDSDFMQIVAKSSEVLNIPMHDLIRGFGQFCFPKLAQLFPQFTSPYKGDAKGFLKTVDQIIHVEVMKLFKGTQLPRLFYDDPASDMLILEYASERKLCAFAEGLIDGSAHYFGQTISQKQTECMHKGAPRCRFELRFA